MAIQILMPALSPTMTEGKLAKWVKSEGDMVEPGDVIAEIETDKATMEVEAVDEGKLAKIIVPEGTDNVPVNELIAVLLEEGEDDSAVDALIASSGGASNTNTESSKSSPESAANKNIDEGTQDRSDASRTVVQTQGSSKQRIFATPLARRIAKEKGVDLSLIQGSGPHGRIVKVDVEAYTPMAKPTSTTEATTSPGGTVMPAGPDAKALADAYGMAYDFEAASSMRKVIASRLLESKQTVPHFYLTVDCEIDRLLEGRKNINADADGFKLSVNDFIIRACALALQKVPAANASWAGDGILQYHDSDISVAVATPNGLVTPIIKSAQAKGLKDISNEMKDLALRAREGKLKPEEYQGGTFTISNLGMYGIKQFGAIINPPQSCILAVGTGEQRPVVKNGQIVPATVMTCTLSVDHRSVDGAVGAEFLSVFKDMIENPLKMLL